jgi:putative transcriptional regulator
MATSHTTPRAGALLVATPVIGDPNFDRSVVLLLHHQPEGSLGVVLNRPAELSVAEALPPWAALSSPPGMVHVGGPVAEGGVLAIARPGAPPPTRGWSELTGGLGALDLTLDPDELGGELAGLRLFAGHSGWGPGQLSGELAVGAWWVFDAADGDTFSPRPEELWWEVVGRQGGEFRMFAHAPVDPSRN